MIELNALQRQLERIYEVAVPHRVEDFLITDRALARRLHGDDARETEEKLLVVQEDDCVDIALFLDPEVVERLANDNPTARLHRGNLADYCTALEGVSHFLYLTWNAAREREVSLLELEMQAEVDKFVSTALLFGEQSAGRVPPRLYDWLFEEVAFDGQLDDSEQRRYRDAHYYAGKYCSRLSARYLRERRGDLVRELRRFYRLTQRAKIDRIESAS